jgi:hypothetical protein
MATAANFAGEPPPPGLAPCGFAFHRDAVTRYGCPIVAGELTTMVDTNSPHPRSSSSPAASMARPNWSPPLAPSINWARGQLHHIITHHPYQYCSQSITNELEFQTFPKSSFRHRKTHPAVVRPIQVSSSPLLPCLSILMRLWCSPTHPIELDRHQSLGTRGSLVHPRGYRGQTKLAHHFWN